MKTPEELANQREIDQDILYYVRQMQTMAQILPGSIHSFLTITRRRRMTMKDVQDRIDYLVSARYLQEEKEWGGLPGVASEAQTGEYGHYRITATGMDVLDGAIPPRGWKST